MSIIHILPDRVANQIAAGEVVERPASIVKELMENAIDAGAMKIEVNVEAGGRRLIRVTDDGCGMDHDDAVLAFERHATSKIRHADDLLEIATLGFRGEALPSIAAVSRLALETRHASEAAGTRVEIAGGKLRDVQEIAWPAGTRIEVRDLFFNTPARRKFLKSESTELGHIASLVTHYALAHPEKAFRLTSLSHEVLNVAPAPDARTRVYQLLGAQVLDQLIEIRPAERSLPAGPPAEDPEDSTEPAGTVRIAGFVSRPEVQRLNRNEVYFFVNRRLVRDRVILHAILEAYRNILPPRMFPVALVFLEMPPHEVDVNVHPSKTEVRFRQSSFVHDFMRDFIRQTLVAARPVAAFPMRRSGPELVPEEIEAVERLAEDATLGGSAGLTQPQLRGPEAVSAALAGSSGAARPLADTRSMLTHEFSRPLDSPAPRSVSPGGFQLSAPRPPAVSGRLPLDVQHEPPSPFAPAERAQGTTSETSPETAPAAAYHPALTVAAQGSCQPSEPPAAAHRGSDARSGADSEFPADLHPLGQVEESYIVATNATGLWILDQHAAHERVLFEQHLRQVRARQVEAQRLLLPIIVELRPQQQILFAEIAEELAANGFEVEPFGQRTVAVKSAPAELAAEDVERLLVDILDGVGRESRAVSLEALRAQISASLACRAAIKIHMVLDRSKMEWLLRALARTESPMSCPHGRPVMLRYTIKELERAFHRI